MNPVKVFLGVTLIIMGLMIYSLSLVEKTNVEFGGIVLVGPIPILVASNAGIAMMVLLIALVILLILSLLR